MKYATTVTEFDTQKKIITITETWNEGDIVHQHRTSDSVDPTTFTDLLRIAQRSKMKSYVRSHCIIFTKHEAMSNDDDTEGD